MGLYFHKISLFGEGYEVTVDICCTIVASFKLSDSSASNGKLILTFSLQNLSSAAIIVRRISCRRK